MTPREQRAAEMFPDRWREALTVHGPQGRALRRKLKRAAETLSDRSVDGQVRERS